MRGEGANGGFTLIEIMIVMALLAVMSVAIAPRVSSYFSSQKKNLYIVSSMISRTFDDSLLRKRTNFLVIHLSNPDTEITDEKNGDFLRKTNGVSVVRIDRDGLITESENPVLKAQLFTGLFTLDEVVTESGEHRRGGAVFIPFYPEGYSENFVLYVTVNNEQMTLINTRFTKTPYIQHGHTEYADFFAKNEK